MKIIITESQFKSLREQTSTPDVNAIKNFVNQKNTSTGTVRPTQTATKPTQTTTSTNLQLKGKTLSPKTAPPEGFGKSNPQGNLHDVATVLGIATLFIPVVGPFISAGIGLADAALYYKEGDTKTAGLVAAFSMLPAVGSVVSKIPGVKQLGVKGMSSLASRLSKGAQITNPVEVAVINGINLNKNLVQSGLNSQVRTLAQQGVSRTTNTVAKAELANLAKNGVKEIGSELATDKAVELIRTKIS